MTKEQKLKDYFFDEYNLEIFDKDVEHIQWLLQGGTASQPSDALHQKGITIKIGYNQQTTKQVEP